MHLRIRVVVVGASAVAMALAMTLPAVIGSTAGASPGQSFHYSFTVKPSGVTVTPVVTTAYSPKQPVSTAAPGSTHLPVPAPVPPGEGPKTPDGGYMGPYGFLGPPGAGFGAGSTPILPSSYPSSSNQSAISGATRGLASTTGIDEFDQGITHPVTGKTTYLPGVDIEPPDQGLCEGNGYTVELNNMVIQIFNSRTLKPVGSSPYGMALEHLFGTPEVFGGGSWGPPSYSVQGDPRCIYDPTTRRWFASELWLTYDDALSYQWSGFFVAVSKTSNPTGAWTSYFVPDQDNATHVDSCSNTLTSSATPTHGPCFGDQPLLGIDQNTIYISTNEYSLVGLTPGGAANVYFLSKSDLERGTGSPVYWAHLGDTVPRPGATTTYLDFPWYSIAPAQSDGSYVWKTTGTLYAVSNVTFTTTGGTSVAVWAFTHTRNINSFFGQPIDGTVTTVGGVKYLEPPEAVQKTGPVPLGHFWKTLYAGTPTKVTPLRTGAEGPVQTNTDRVTTVAYDPADGSLWAALNAGITPTGGPAVAAVAWFTMTPNLFNGNLQLWHPSSGFLSAKGANTYFPSITFDNTGTGLMTYGLSGTNYYPSSAYTFLNQWGPTGSIHIARAGVGPEDGFTEYTPSYNRQRWGDYATAVSDGNTFYFADEMINQSCTDAQYDPFTKTGTFTCGGTRDLFGNWGTAVMSLPAGHQGFFGQ
jgi:hypothetical protein